MSRISLEELRHAIESGAITTVYQPIVRLADEWVVGAEALARWGDIGPAVFAPQAEANGLAEPLTARIIDNVGNDLAELLQSVPRFYVSLNVPPPVLGSGVLRDAASRVGLLERTHQIVIEITERQVLHETGREAIRAARNMGARVAIDDFGTGESGLKQLIGLEFDVLKIDQAFVGLLPDDGAVRLIRGIVALANTFDVDLVGEGIETEEQAKILRWLGVQCGQGYYFHRPMPAKDLIALFD